MFQNFKRMHFIAKNNFSHFNVRDASHMYVWLKEHGWPVNEFIDLYMRVIQNNNGYQSPFDSFELYLCSQFEWLNDNDKNSLSFLISRLEGDDFRQSGSDPLLKWLKEIQSDVS